MLTGRNILLGVTGSIAAYKSAHLVRLLVKKGACVKVILTPAAREFITPLTLATLSKNAVHTDFVEDPATGVWTNHVELGLWSDLFVIAPLTANTLSDMAAGKADNLLTCTYLSCRSKVMIAPAMDLDMFAHDSTKENLKTLIQRGVLLLPSPSGELASGLSGEGRMDEPEDIADAIEHYFNYNNPLAGKRVLITAGPTYEPIDPVRFIGNHSTGKMGFALAERAALEGACVHLISGPSALDTPKGVIRIDVMTARQMADAVLELFQETDIAIMSAAVADFKPKHVAPQKIKKQGGVPLIELEPTVDILKTVGSIKKEHQILIGFALETNDVIHNATQKLITKNADLIVLNSPGENTGFGSETNQVTLITQNNTFALQLLSKRDTAKEIWNIILKEFLQ